MKTPNNIQKILSPEAVGLEPIAELVTPYGTMWQIDDGDYSSMAEEIAGAAADSGYYSLSNGMTDCMLTRNFADVIENSSVPAPLSEIMPVMSDGDWSTTQTYPVMEQPDLVSAFAPVCCGGGEGPSMVSNMGFKSFHAATFALSWKLCIPELLKMKGVRPGYNPEAHMQEQIAQVVNYASSYLAINGGNGIDGLLSNNMVGAFWSPLPFAQMNGTDILAVLSAAVSSLDPNNMPKRGYTLYLPTRTWQRLGMTPYSSMNPARLISIITGGCTCPDAVANLAGMISAVKPLEMLRGAVDVASGDIALMLPTEDANSSAAGASAFWYRPIPMLPLEVQQMGLSRYGTVLVHTGDVIVKRPRQALKIYNV
jgi:hypothetical protein